MSLSNVGLFVQTVGAGLLEVIFLYLSRGKGNRVLNAAGFGWLFLFISLSSLLVSYEITIPFATLPYQYFKILSYVALTVGVTCGRLNDALNIPAAVDWTWAGVSVDAIFIVPRLAASAAACMALRSELPWL